MEETVVNVQALSNMFDLMIESKIYSNEYINGLKEIIDAMLELKEEYLKNSNYYKILPIENSIHEKQEIYLEMYLRK